MTTYRALLHWFRLICDDALVDDYLRQVLAPLRDEPAAPDRVMEYRLVCEDGSPAISRLTVDGQDVTGGPHPAGPIGRFLGLIDRDAERVTAARFPVLHAAAAHRSGRTVVVPGAPNAGKSTLMAHLALNGWTYLSDELVAIMPGTPPTLLAYPRSIVLDEGSWSLFPGWTLQPRFQVSSQLPPRRHLVPPDASRPPHGASYPITDVTLYRWQARMAPSVSELDAVECLRCLLGSSFSMDHSPQRDLDILAQVVDSADSWQVRGAQLDSVRPRLFGPPGIR